MSQKRTRSLGHETYSLVQIFVVGLLTQTAFRRFGIFVDPSDLVSQRCLTITQLCLSNLLMQIDVALSGEPKNK